jgi:hypothetical protein
MRADGWGRVGNDSHADADADAPGETIGEWGDGVEEGKDEYKALEYGSDTGRWRTLSPGSTTEDEEELAT